MNHEVMEAKTRRITAAANSIGWVVRDIRVEGEKAVISFIKEEKPSDGTAALPAASDKSSGDYRLA